MSYYYNAAGQRFPLPERPLEPPDCREPEVEPEADPVLDFDPDTHIYRLDGIRLPSVTQLTDIYGANVESPDLELTMEAAAERGSILHGYIEHRLRGRARGIMNSLTPMRTTLTAWICSWPSMSWIPC